MRQSDALRFGDQAEERPVAVEAPRASVFYDFKSGLVVTVEQFVGDPAGGRLVGQLKRSEPNTARRPL